MLCKFPMNALCELCSYFSTSFPDCRGMFDNEISLSVRTEMIHTGGDFHCTFKGECG